MRVAIFTDNDFGKVNGVTTALRALLAHAPRDVQPRIYTMSDVAEARPDYLALAAPGVPIPYYADMRLYRPRVGSFRRRLSEDGVEVVHLTTPGPVGVAGRYLAT